MAGGDVDAADGLAMADGVGDDGRGRVAVAQERLDAVGRENFGGGEGKMAAQKAGVVAEDDDGFATVDFGFWIAISDFR